MGAGQRIPLRLPMKVDEWLFVTHATEIPLFVWIVLAKSVRVERPPGDTTLVRVVVATRCFSPPDRWQGRRSDLSARARTAKLGS